MAYARQVPWHKFGHNNGDQLMTADEAFTLSGLDWTVSAREMFTLDSEGEYISTKFRAIVRDSDDRVFGSVGERYETFQNRELFDFLQDLTDCYGKPVVEVAGALNFGSRVFAICKLEDLDVNLKFLTEAEMHNWYLFVRSTHDGSGSITAEPTGVRVVCCNTERMAINARNKEKGFVSIRHTTNYGDRIAQAKESLGVVTAYAQLLDEAASIMAESKLELEELDKVLASLTPIPAERGKEKAETLRDDLRSHVLGTPTVAKELKGTRWGAFQGITEFFEHEAETRHWGKTPELERRMLANFDGKVDRIRNKAWNLLQPV